MNFQSIAALLIVFATTAIVIYLNVKAKKEGSCGGGCGCSNVKKNLNPNQKKPESRRVNNL